MIILVGVYILRYLYIYIGMLCELHIVIALASLRCAIFRYSL